MDKETAGKKARSFRLAKIISILLAAGLVYYVFVTLTGLYIPCVFRLITGWKCPGCGVSHMLVALLRLDFKGAFSENPFAFLLLPFLIGYGIYRALRYILRNDRTYKRWENTAAAVVVVIAVIFGIVRNLTGI